MALIDTPSPLPTLSVEAWPDPVIDDLGVDPRGAYTERFWLPVLGPSTVWFLRLVADRLDETPDGFALDLTDTAQCLGVGMRGGRNAPIMKTVERCCRFGAARMYGHTNLAVRRRLAPLNRAQVERLPESLQADHGTWLTRPNGRTGSDQLIERARRLALSLVELGETPEACERQLHRWRFHPAVAFDAVRWAMTAHQAMGPPPRPTPTVGVSGSSQRAVAASVTPLSVRVAAPLPGSPPPSPVPTEVPTPGSRSTRPRRPSVDAPRPTAAGGPARLSDATDEAG